MWEELWNSPADFTSEFCDIYLLRGDKIWLLTPLMASHNTFFQICISQTHFCVTLWGGVWVLVHELLSFWSEVNNSCGGTIPWICCIILFLDHRPTDRKRVSIQMFDFPIRRSFICLVHSLIPNTPQLWENISSQHTQVLSHSLSGFLHLKPILSSLFAWL